MKEIETSIGSFICLGWRRPKPPSMRSFSLLPDVPGEYNQTIIITVPTCSFIMGLGHGELPRMETNYECCGYNYPN